MSTPVYGGPFDALRHVTDCGREFWSARDLMGPFGYSRWERFSDAIGRAKISAHNAGYQVTDHFPGAAKVSGTRGPAQEDYHLSRFGAYLVALNGDPRKPEIAAAQAYFVIRTRQAETAPQHQVPQSMAEALRLAADQHERADREQAARQAAEQHAAALEAPAAAWGHMAGANGDYGVGDAAKILARDPAITIGRDRLFTHMADRKWIYRTAGHRAGWRAYQTQVDCGRLVERMGRPFLNERTGGTELPPPTIRVTAKGLAELHKQLGGQLPSLEAPK